MNNPFIFGEIVTDDAFCDREGEQEALLRDLKDSQKIFLISPRRFGKTSLLKEVLRSLQQEGLITVYLDLYRTPSVPSFVEHYTASVARATESVMERALHLIRDVLPRLRPKITIDADGQPSIGIEPLLGKKNLSDALEEALEMPAVVATRKRKKLAVVFDEFQEIAQFNGESFEKTMRSHVQGHRDVGYVFSGSKKHLLEEMTRRENRAFYKIGKTLYLQKIPRDIFLPFLMRKFIDSGFAVDPGTLERALDLTGEVPYNVQFVCHELWDLFRDERRLSPADVDRVMTRIIEEQTPFFLTQWDALSLKQRAALKAIATHGGSGVFSQEFLGASGLSSLATLQTSLKLLVKKGIIEKPDNGYVIGDLFLQEWIRRKM